MIPILLNINLFVMVLFLIFAAVFFIHEAWKKRETPANTIGSLVSAYFLLNSLIIMIWR